MIKEHRFPYEWNLKGRRFRKNSGTVFSCFAGVGGSTMGYKLAGFDVVGMNEVDEKIAECYIVNHKPRYRYIEPMQDFKVRKRLPEELYNLDILDGSPPCSPFSIAGRRSKDWGRERKFTEGKFSQVLDTLFFDFIDLAKRLQPKIVMAENVPAILYGEAVKYVWRIYKEFGSAGYHLQYFVIDSSRMGVPQKRKRIFFVALRKDLMEPFLVEDGLLLVKPGLVLRWSEPIIRFGQVRSAVGQKGKDITKHVKELLKYRIKLDESLGSINMRLRGVESGFGWAFVRDHLVCPTIIAGTPFFRDYDNLLMTDQDIVKVSTFPSDFDFCETTPRYACGMSVPPVMMAQVSSEIYRQWLSRLKNG